jgi:phosphoenolpyruvate synthase/pyruvate phosphate dikinase
MAWTRLLTELRRDDAAEFGGKSANLGELLAAEIPVPPGFAIAASADQESSGEVPNDLRTELAARYAELGEPAVAVRSSGLGEDSQEASYAGQAETYLWVRGIDELCEAVLECWASLDTERAVAYRAKLGVTDAAMGVTVQKMVDAEVSGVTFTCNPVSGDPSMIAVNASWGLGLAVVGGETNPDDFLVSKVTGEVVRRTINSKEIEYVVEPGGRGTARVEVPADRREVSCLGDTRLAELVALAKRIERHFGSHQDIEWSIERGTGTLYALQARPVTAERDAPTVSGSAISLVMDAFGAGDRR